MKALARDVLLRFFGELERGQIAYVILHSYAELPAKIASDIDYAVRDADLSRVRRLLRETANAAGWVVAQSLQHEVTGYYDVLIDPADPEQFLKLDLCSHYLRNARLLMTDEELLGDLRRSGAFHIPAPAVELCYLLIKALAKRKDLDGCAPRLRELFALDPKGAQVRMAAIFGETASHADEWLARTAATWPTLEPRNRTAQLLKLKEVVRIASRLRNPTGLHVAFLGPDGSGKSTLIAEVSRLMGPCFRRVVVCHFRPRIGGASAGTPVAAPHAKAPRTRLVGWLKLVCYFADHVAGYAVQLAPAIRRSRLVIFDRNFDDLLIDPRRYRFARVEPLARLLRCLLPRAERTFVLLADAAVIHARKPELPLPEIERQLAALKTLAESDRRYVIVRADRPPAESARQVCRELIELLASRTREREP